MLHLNVPAKQDTYLTISFRKARWLLLGILAPEVPMLFACGQWASAKRSVAEMQKLGYDSSQWSLEHAFYADSGGFELQPPDEEPFPVTAKQVRYLVQNGYMDLPKITRKEIWDKSNADKFTKFCACFQTAWLVTQTIGRGIERLTITPLEVSSIALALTSLTTLYFWLHKPLDVETPTTLAIPSTTKHIIFRAQERIEEIQHTDYIHTNTPLDFIEPNLYISRKWSKHLLSYILHFNLQTQPLTRIPND
jgi:hypothetical protein